MIETANKRLNRRINKFLDRIFSKTPMAKKLQKTIDFAELQKIESVLNQHGFTFRQFKNILEFGCRDGRLTRYLFDLAPRGKIFGCDIALKELKNCRKKFPQGCFIHNKTTAPLPLEDNQFDFIYSYSVFTHLSEENQKNWLKELSRVLKLGGVMLHTIHSYECLKRLSLFSPESIGKYGLPEDDVEKFIQSAKPYHYTIDNEKMPEYGLTIIHSDYVAKMWPLYSNTKVLEHAVGAIECYPEGPQDIVLMAKI